MIHNKYAVYDQLNNMFLMNAGITINIRNFTTHLVPVCIFTSKDIKFYREHNLFTERYTIMKWEDALNLKILVD